MISKELLSVVLNFPRASIVDIQIKNNLINYFTYALPAYRHESINIYEFGHECREWAFKKGYALYIKIRPDIMNLKDVDHFYVVQLGFGSDKTARQFHADTEVEAVFQACEWILKEQNDIKTRT